MRFPMVSLSALFFLLVSWGPGAVQNALAQQPFYKGKTIRIIVPYTPGGGFDVSCRIIARNLPRLRPGPPSCDGHKRAGGGGTIGPNYLYNVAKRDGLTIGMAHGSLTIAETTGQPSVKFKMDDFNWIGSIDLGPVVLSIRRDLPHKTIDDFRKEGKPLFLTASGPANSSHDYPRILKLYGKLNLKITTGYRGLANEMAAIQRGEADGRAGSLPSILRFSEVVKVVIGGERARPLVPDIIDVRKIVTSQEGRQLIDALGAPQRIGRALTAPPGVPAERVEILRTAWNKLIHDPKFLSEMKKAVLIKPEDLTTGQDIKKVLAQVKSLPEHTWSLLINKIQKR